jgi:hypothetical protein
MAQTLKQVFFDLKHQRSPLGVSKNIGDCMRSHNDSNGITLDPPLLWPYNTFKKSFFFHHNEFVIYISQNFSR